MELVLVKRKVRPAQHEAIRLWRVEATKQVVAEQKKERKQGQRTQAQKAAELERTEWREKNTQNVRRALIRGGKGMYPVLRDEGKGSFPDDEPDDDQLLFEGASAPPPYAAVPTEKVGETGEKKKTSEPCMDEECPEEEGKVARVSTLDKGRRRELEQLAERLFSGMNEVVTLKPLKKVEFRYTMSTVIKAFEGWRKREGIVTTISKEYRTLCADMESESRRRKMWALYEDLMEMIRDAKEAVEIENLAEREVTLRRQEKVRDAEEDGRRLGGLLYANEGGKTAEDIGVLFDVSGIEIRMQAAGE